MHEPPRRIHVQLPFSDVCISDYLFPGETPYDSNDSVEEIFGYKPKIEWMNDELELVAAPKETLVRIDPLGGSTITVGSDHYFHTGFPSICPRFKIAQNK